MIIDRNFFENDWIVKFIRFNKRKPKHEEIMAFRTGFNAGEDFHKYKKSLDCKDKEIKDVKQELSNK